MIRDVECLKSSLVKIVIALDDPNRMVHLIKRRQDWKRRECSHFNLAVFNVQGPVNNEAQVVPTYYCQISWPNYRCLTDDTGIIYHDLGRIISCDIEQEILAGDRARNLWIMLWGTALLRYCIKSAKRDARS